MMLVGYGIWHRVEVCSCGFVNSTFGERWALVGDPCLCCGARIPVASRTGRFKFHYAPLWGWFPWWRGGWEFREDSP